MSPKNNHAAPATDRLRERLLLHIQQLAQKAVFGTLSESYRTCGTASCRCHHGGPKHGPHLYISFRSAQGKTAGYYVPKALEAQMREATLAWQTLQEDLRTLSSLNKETLWKRDSKK